MRNNKVPVVDPKYMKNPIGPAAISGLQYKSELVLDVDRYSGLIVGFYLRLREPEEAPMPYVDEPPTSKEST